ncbi:MAG TPA: hypothetical protein VMF32_10175 [Xanthobacteraceae bacterium]|nr:hypothetical protein [Xanthobacteraceae bacterium]
MDENGLSQSETLAALEAGDIGVWDWRAPIDLLFTDLVMPGDLTGVMLAREAQRLRPGLPVLLATGYAGFDEPAEGEFPVIAKPFRAAELSRVLGRLIRGAYGARGVQTE